MKKPRYPKFLQLNPQEHEIELRVTPEVGPDLAPTFDLKIAEFEATVAPSKTEALAIAKFFKQSAEAMK